MNAFTCTAMLVLVALAAPALAQPDCNTPCTAGATTIQHMQMCHTASDVESCTFDNACSGVEVTVEGVVTGVVDQGFFIQQPGVSHHAGIYVYIPDKSKRSAIVDGGILPAVLNVVSVTGEGSEYHGVSQLKATAVSVVSEAGAMPEAVAVTASVLESCSAEAEALEGMVVQVDDVEVDRLADYGEVYVKDATGTMQVDDMMGDMGTFSALAPGDKFSMLRGVVHYGFGSFELHPLSSGGFGTYTKGSEPEATHALTGHPCVCTAGEHTIQHIQACHAVVDVDKCVHDTACADVEVTLPGIVTAVADSGFFMQQTDGATAHAGIFVYVPDKAMRKPVAEGGLMPAVGNEVAATGEASEYRNLSQLKATAVTVTAAAGTMPEPVTITAAHLEECSHSAEELEGMLVQIGEVEIAKMPDEYGQIWVRDETGEVQVDRMFGFADVGVVHPGFKLDDKLMGLTGVVHYRYSSFEILPLADGGVGALVSEGGGPVEVALALTIKELTEHPEAAKEGNCTHFDTPYKGQLVQVEGVVTHTTPSAFFMQDGEGPFSGLRVHVMSGFREPVAEGGHLPAAGDTVVVQGRADEYHTSTQLNNLVMVQVFSAADVDMPEPFPVETGDFAEHMCTGAAEQFEGVLVKVSNLQIKSNPDQYKQVMIDSGAGEMELEGYYEGGGELTVFDKYSDLAVDDYISYIIGVVDYTYGYWSIIPRTADDIGPKGMWMPPPPPTPPPPPSPPPKVDDAALEPAAPTDAPPVDTADSKAAKASSFLAVGLVLGVAVVADFS